MGQTTANYKPPCAEMSYDLGEVSTGRTGSKKILDVSRLGMAGMLAEGQGLRN